MNSRVLDGLDRFLKSDSIVYFVIEFGYYIYSDVST